MKVFCLFLFFHIAGILTSCQQTNHVAENNDLMNAEEKTAALTEADNAFGLSLFQNIERQKPDENRLVSPLSVSVVLTMAYNGAGKETKAEMEKTMNLAGLSKEQINASYQKLLSELKSVDEKVVFEIANALYYSGSFSVRPDFMNVNRSVYDAEITGLDFSSPAAVDEINNWVKNKTKGKIDNIIRQLQPADRMVLLNAIYFYGTWTEAFNEYGTQNHVFTKNDGSSVEVPMMNKLDKVPYMEAGSFKAVKLPYGNGRYSMAVFLPGENHNAQDLIRSLTAENWKAWMKDFRLTDRVNITMPRFKFEYEASLKNVLASMGMQLAFVPEKADFSGISDEDLFISEIKHKSYIDVNETGTEAAAVTSAVFTATSMQDEPPMLPFFVNKPFLFAITEENTGTILFIGEVNLPEYNL